MILVGISGKRGAGKDTLADILVKKYGFLKKSFAEELKRKVREDFGLTKEHTDGKLKEQPTDFLNTPYEFHTKDICPESYWTPRQIMIEYGQFFRRFDPNFWVKKVFDSFPKIPCFVANNQFVRICISDVRFKNEADYIRKEGGLLIRLERKPELNIYGPEAINDISETDLDNYKFDYVLPADKNIGPKDLEVFAEEILTSVKA